MARKPRAYLDEIDKKILNLLQEDSRLSFTDIAKRLRIPQSTARFKVLNLISRGYVKRFTAIVDHEKVGYPYAIIMMLTADLNKVDDIINKFTEMEEVQHVFQTTGKHDIVAIFRASTLQHVNEVVKKVKTTDGIKEAETLLVTGRIVIKPELPIK